MRDRLLEGGAAQRLVARLAPPFDREFVEAGLSEMMGDDLRLGRRRLWLPDQDFRRTAVQRLAAALEQALVGRVLDQRVLEAVVRLRAATLGDEEVRVDEPVERGLEGGVVDPAHGAQQRVGKITAQYGADLRDFARFAALEQQARNLLNEQRHPAGALADAPHHVP